jgi:hypothetical protein
MLLVGGDNFPFDTGRCTGPRGMGFSSNGRWHLQRPNSWHGQHDHHGDQPGDWHVYVFERLQSCI